MFPRYGTDVGSVIEIIPVTLPQGAEEDEHCVEAAHNWERAQKHYAEEKQAQKRQMYDFRERGGDPGRRNAALDAMVQRVDEASAAVEKAQLAFNQATNTWNREQRLAKLESERKAKQDQFEKEQAALRPAKADEKLVSDMIARGPYTSIL